MPADVEVPIVIVGFGNADNFVRICPHRRPKADLRPRLTAGSLHARRIGPVYANSSRAHLIAFAVKAASGSLTISMCPPGRLCTSRPPKAISRQPASKGGDGSVAIGRSGMAALNRWTRPEYRLGR